MDKKNEKPLPKVAPEVLLNTYKDAKLACKEEEKNYRALEPEVKKILSSGFKCDYLRLVEKTPAPSINAEQAQAWAAHACSKKEYESLFVKSFDINRFVEMLKVLPKQIKETMPEGTIVQGKPRTEVHLISAKPEE